MEETPATQYIFAPLYGILHIPKMPTLSVCGISVLGCEGYHALARPERFSALYLAHLALTALRALSERSLAVIEAALAGPPFKPPRRPSITAAAFFLCVF